MTILELYNAFEIGTLNTLTYLISQSNYVSPHTGSKALSVSLFDYTELVIIEGELLFLDKNGSPSQLYYEAEPSDIMDIIVENGGSDFQIL